MAAVTSEGVPGARHRLAERLRAAVLGPRGGGTTRRRASDAFRLALAVVVVLVSIPVMRWPRRRPGRCASCSALSWGRRPGGRRPASWPG